MSAHFHAVIWIDHVQAKIFHFNKDDAQGQVIKPEHAVGHIHHHANEIGSGHVATSAAYLHAVAQAVADSGAILIVGPANARTELMQHLQKHDPKVAERVSAVETVDHPSDGQLLAYARNHFKSADKDTPQM